MPDSVTAWAKAAKALTPHSITLVLSFILLGGACAEQKKLRGVLTESCAGFRARNDTAVTERHESDEKSATSIHLRLDSKSFLTAQILRSNSCFLRLVKFARLAIHAWTNRRTALALSRISDKHSLVPD